VIVVIWGVERISATYGTSLFVGLGRFAVRDVATLLALLPGSWMLAKRRRWDIAFALNAAALALLIVYYWAEPRESRYLTHLLPFMIPAAAGVALKTRRQSEGSRIVPVRIARVAASAAVLVAVAAAVGVQGVESIKTADADFLESAYPREVAEGLVGHVPPGSTVLTALPWPYYFHLRETTWGAGAAYSTESLELLPKNRMIFVLEDASFRFHDRRLAKALSKVSDPVVEFQVPIGYLYG
jgi:hypothetical protein